MLTHPTPIRLAIADDHALVREGIVNLLQCTDAFSIITEADNGADLIEKISASDLQPDICIIDLNMPIMDGYETQIDLKKKYPFIRSLTLTVEDSPYNILRMFQAGTNGYLLKTSSSDELFRALTSIHSKGFYYTDEITEKFSSDGKFDFTPILTTKEEDFLKHCCSLSTFREIGLSMNLSEKTVQHYAERISKKLSIKNNRLAFAMYSLRSGIGKFTT